jgi:hypothetical protein
LLCNVAAPRFAPSLQCKAYLANYANNKFKKERHLLLIAIEAGAGKVIATATDLEIRKKQQVRYLKDDRFIDENAASEAVDLLAYALRGDRNKSTSVANSADFASAIQFVVANHSAFPTKAKARKEARSRGGGAKTKLGKLFLIKRGMIAATFVRRER